MSYDLPWANVSNAPFRLFKHWVHEGGISTPLIVHWPARVKHSGPVHSPCHVIDILPTILEATDTPYPSELGGAAIQQLDGESLMQLLEGRPWQRERPLFWEHEGNAAVRVGDFKLVRQFGKDWELYDMESDRTELTDLMGRNDPLTRRLVRDYEEWAHSIGVKDWAEALPVLQRLWGMEDVNG